MVVVSPDSGDTVKLALVEDVLVNARRLLYLHIPHLHTVKHQYTIGNTVIMF